MPTTSLSLPGAAAWLSMLLLSVVAGVVAQTTPPSISSAACEPHGCAVCCNTSDAPIAVVLRYIGGYSVTGSQRSPEAAVVPPSAAVGPATISVANGPTFTAVRVGDHLELDSLNRWLEITVRSESGVQRISIRADCASPLMIGNVFGSLAVLRATRSDGSIAGAHRDSVAVSDCPVPGAGVNGGNQSHPDRDVAVLDPGATGTNCKYDSVCSAAAAQQGKLALLTFSLINSNRLADRNVNLQSETAVTEPYLPEIPTGSVAGERSVRVDVDIAGDQGWYTKLFDGEQFDVETESSARGWMFPSVVNFTIGRGSSRAQISISTDCNANDIRVGDTFGALRVDGYELRRANGLSDTPTVACNAASSFTVSTGNRRSSDDDTDAELELITIIGGVVMGLLLIMIVVVGRVVIKRGRFAEHHTSQLVNPDYRAPEERISDVTWNNSQTGGYVRRQSSAGDEDEVGRLIAQLVSVHGDSPKISNQWKSADKVDRQLSSSGDQLPDLRFDDDAHTASRVETRIESQSTVGADSEDDDYLHVTPREAVV